MKILKLTSTESLRAAAKAFYVSSPINEVYLGSPIGEKSRFSHSGFLFWSKWCPLVLIHFQYCYATYVQFHNSEGPADLSRDSALLRKPKRLSDPHNAEKRREIRTQILCTVFHRERNGYFWVVSGAWGAFSPAWNTSLLPLLSAELHSLHKS